MNKDDLDSWREHPVTVKLLALLTLQGAHREETLKDRWFNGDHPTDGDLAYLDGYTTVVETLSTITADQYEELKEAVE